MPAAPIPARAPSANVADAPGPRSPASQVTTWPATEQPAGVPSGVSPAGIVSVTTTSVAVASPSLRTVRLNVVSAPTCSSPVSSRVFSSARSTYCGAKATVAVSSNRVALLSSPFGVTAARLGTVWPRVPGRSVPVSVTTRSPPTSICGMLQSPSGTPGASGSSPNEHSPVPPAIVIASKATCASGSRSPKKTSATLGPRFPTTIV